MKKIVSILLCAAAIGFAVPMQALAEYAVKTAMSRAVE